MNLIAPFRFPSSPDLSPPQPFHKYPDLPLFKRIWSPAAFQDMSILTWSYRITFSAMSFMFIAFLVDAVVGNLYRYTFGNLKIYIDNERFNEKQKIYVKERNRVLANWGLAATAIIGAAAAIYFLKRSYFPSITSGNLDTNKKEIVEITTLRPPIETVPDIRPEKNSSLSRFLPNSFVPFLGVCATLYVSPYLLNGVHRLWTTNHHTYFDTGEVLEGETTQNGIDAPHACTFISYHAAKAMLLNSLNRPADILPLLRKGKEHYDQFFDQNRANIGDETEFPWHNVYTFCHQQPDRGRALHPLDRYGRVIPANNTYGEPYQPPARGTHLQDFYQSLLDQFRRDHLDRQLLGTKMGAILTAKGYTFSLAFTKEADHTEKVELFDSHGTTAFNADRSYSKEYNAYKITFSGPDSYRKLIVFLKERYLPANGQPGDFGLYPVLLG